MKDNINVESISSPDELLLELNESYSEARARCINLLAPIFLMFLAASLLNIWEFKENPNNLIPLFGIIGGAFVTGLFAFIIFRIYGEKKPTMDDAQAWHRQKLKAAISKSLGNTPVDDYSFSGTDFQPIGIMDEMAFYNKCDKDEDSAGINEWSTSTLIEGEIHSLKFNNVPHAVVIQSHPQRIVVKGNSEREVDRINSKVEGGVLTVFRDPLKIGNQIFYGHVGAAIETNHGSININNPSSFSVNQKSVQIDGVDISSTDVSIEIYLEKPLQE